MWAEPKPPAVAARLRVSIKKTAGRVFVSRIADLAERGRLVIVELLLL